MTWPQLLVVAGAAGVVVLALALAWKQIRTPQREVER